jgi:hypothetical protein
MRRTPEDVPIGREGSPTAGHAHAAVEQVMQSMERLREIEDIAQKVERIQVLTPRTSPSSQREKLFKSGRMGQVSIVEPVEGSAGRRLSVSRQKSLPAAPTTSLDASAPREGVRKDSQ